MVDTNDSNDKLFRKIISRVSENDDLLRKFCKNANITLEKMPVVEVEQVSPVIVNTYSEATNTNKSMETESSGAVDNRKRKRHSSERDQEHEKKENKQLQILDSLTKLLVADKQLNTSEASQEQGYVTKEKYVRLMAKYNNLQADYAALQERFKLTLKLLETSAAESDTDEEDIIEEESSECEKQHDTQHLPLDHLPNGSNVDGITSDQWEYLAGSNNVKQFAQRALRLLFDEETLLISTVSGKPSIRYKNVDGKQSEPKMLDKNKIQTIRVWLEQYLGQGQFQEDEKEDERRSLSRYISLYIAYLKYKHRNTANISLINT